jgi:rootletin
VELELGQVSRERGDLSNQLSSLARKKDALNEEIMRIRQRWEQANETNARLNRDLEDLVKDKEEKQVKEEFSVSVNYTKLSSGGTIFKTEN